MTKIVVNEKGQKVVCIEEIVFSCKRKVDWSGIEHLLKQYIGKTYVIDETDDAKFGWYRCTVRFSIPICDDKGNIVGCNNYQGRMIIRCDSDGKKYLYDIIDIKKET